jgi:hypothetical protein
VLFYDSPLAAVSGLDGFRVLGKLLRVDGAASVVEQFLNVLLCVAERGVILLRETVGKVVREGVGCGWDIGH